MLIDATHAEETRVVVLDGNRLEDFDVETATKRQIKGNIYLAKVIRVEPSLQAAFVEYGGNRHGFLAFAEIHPDYYQIPVADRQRLMAMQAEDERAMQAEDEAAPVIDGAAGEPAAEVIEEADDGAKPDAGDEHQASSAQPLMVTEISIIAAEPPSFEADPEPAPLPMGDDEAGAAPPSAPDTGYAESGESGSGEMGPVESGPRTEEIIEEQAPPETLGGSDDTGDEAERRATRRFMRHYKIQEVIHRRQIMLIQVVKEERGNKGAALTTYVSLAGRFSVLMPNSPNGGGVSRKITSAADRKRLKEVMTELDIPDGMGLIVRTAGANRPKPEIKRDCEYLLRLWDQIRECTLKSSAPALIYEEGNLIKRSIRDLYKRDIDEVYVAGEEAYKGAREFMDLLMPS
ncbi:MAG: ribonuclease E/G, partial [Acidocella sp. 21-58-7]